MNLAIHLVVSGADAAASWYCRLFGFVEHGYRMAIVVAIVAEVAAAVFLVAFLLANGTGLDQIRGSSAREGLGRE